MSPGNPSDTIDYSRLLRSLETPPVRPEWLRLRARVFSPVYGMGEVTLLLGGILRVSFDEDLEVIEYRNWRDAIAKDEIQPAIDATQQDLDEAVFEQIPHPVHQTLARQWAPLLNHVEVLPPKAAITGAIPDDLPEALQQAIRSLGIDQLYSHQIEALEAYRQGENIYLCTETASGKTLAFQVAIVESAIRHKRTTLMLFPTNALIDDQTDSIEEFLGLVNATHAGKHPDIRTVKLVGGIGNRQSLLSPSPDLILTNPEVLNHQIGKIHHSGYEGWKDFLRRLQTVVIDEAHYQTGGFGANVANLIRRVRMAVKRADGNPNHLQFILCSATVRNPEILARLLTQQKDDVPLRVIQESGAGNPGRTILCFKPGAGKTGKVCQITQDLLNSKLSSLVFFNSRESAKNVLNRVHRELKRTHMEHNIPKIALFHSSIRAKRKQAIITGLESSSIQQVFSTSALEAGIDIPWLDVSVIWGFPGVSAFRQRSGRSGRGSIPGLTLFIPMNQKSLDYYYSNHPNALIHGEVESAMLNPDYPLRLSQHLLACAQECQIHPLELEEFFGPMAEAIAGELLEQGLLSCPNGYLIARGRPQDQIQMRGSGYSQVELINQDGRLLEKLSRSLAMREVYPGALYNIQSEDGSLQQYRSESLDLEAQRAILKPVIPASSFNTKTDSSIEIEAEQAMNARTIHLDIAELQGALELSLFWGSIREIATGYSEYLTQAKFTCSNSSCLLQGQVLGNQRLCSCCRGKLEISKIEQKLIRSVEFPTPYEQGTEGPILILQCDHSLQTQIQQEVGLMKAQLRERYPNKLPKRYDDLFKCDPVRLALHTLSHQLVMAMPLLVRYGVSDLRDLGMPVQPEQAHQWAIFDAGNGGNGASEYVFENAETLAKQALSMSHCKCESSACPQCLTIQQCPENNQGLYRSLGVLMLRAVVGSSNLYENSGELSDDK